jgi:hypothetical protein
MNKSTLEHEMSELCRIFSSSRTLKVCGLLQNESSNATQEDMIQKEFPLPAPERYVRKQKSATKINNISSTSACIAPQSPAAAATCIKSVVLYADPCALFEATICSDAMNNVADKFGATVALNDSK